VKEDEVSLVLKDIRRDVVYLVGMSGGKGSPELQPDMKLRQLLSSATLDENLDQVQVQVFREGKKVSESLVSDLLKGDKNALDIPLQADDVIALTPVPFIRVWMTGMVGKTGQIKLPAGTDAYKAIAAAGGVRSAEIETVPALQDEVRLVVRRGPENIEVPSRQSNVNTPFVLESGDTVSVIPPETRRITIGGEINKPGEIVMRGDHSLMTAIAAASGPNQAGSLTNVMILRHGELFSIDASGPVNGKPISQFNLESGDLVFIQRNERTFLVLGEISKPGKIAMKEGMKYHLADALAEVDGLSGHGTNRRVNVVRPDSTGKMQVHLYNLDEFLKDGKTESNPEILPGDCILFGEPKGFTFQSALQAISGAILFQSLGRARA
jgi:protein involved in polysaccharide export with SLBB domain